MPVRSSRTFLTAATLLLVQVSGALDARSQAFSDVQSFAADFRELKTKLSGLQDKIDATNASIAHNLDGATAKRHIDTLQANVARLLASVADNGTLALLGQRALDHTRQRMKDLREDTHFSPEQRNTLVARWQAIVAGTELAVSELTQARNEFADLLRALQANGDYLLALQELDQAQDIVAALQRLTDELRECSTRLRQLHTRMTAPSLTP